MSRQILIRFPVVKRVPLAPGDLVQLKNGQRLTVRSLRLMVTEHGTRWAVLDANGIAWCAEDMAEIISEGK